MEILSKIWSYFATNILQQPAFMIGFIVLIGYILLQRPWYDILAVSYTHLLFQSFCQTGYGNGCRQYG